MGISQKNSRHRLIISFAISALLFVLMSPGYSEANKLVIQISFSDGTRVEAEPVFTDKDRARGLMFRTFLPPNAGMLFLFRELELHGFWMKNTLIPLDLIWINERKEIVYFVTAEPCKADPCASYRSLQKAQYVLEVNGGFAKKHQLKIGDRLDFNIPSEIERRIE